MKASSVVRLSFDCVRRFLKEDLHLKPYKVHEYHELKPSDYAKRVGFADWLLSLPPEALTKMIVSDVAWFYLTLTINQQNDLTWTKKNPLEYIERPQKLLISLLLYSKCHGVAIMVTVYA